MEVLQNLIDWEINEYKILSNTMELVLLNEDYDQSVWTLSASRKFTVGSFYRYLVKKELMESNFPYKQILMVKAPQGSFLCEAGWVCILTNNKLKRRGKIIVNWCCLCKKMEETCNICYFGVPLHMACCFLAYGIIILEATVFIATSSWSGKECYHVDLNWKFHQIYWI